MPKWIKRIKGITGRFPVCAIFPTDRTDVMEKLKLDLHQRGITGIYVVPWPGRELLQRYEYNLSDGEQFQWLELLHGCLQEGDRALAVHDLKKICTNPRCRLLYEKTKKEAKEANQKMSNEVEERKQEKKSLQHEIKELKRKCEESLTSNECLANENAILKSEMVCEREFRNQFEITLKKNVEGATHAVEMYKKRELELDEKLKPIELNIGTMAENLQNTEKMARREVEPLQKKQKKKVDTPQLMASGNQAQGPSTSQDDSTGGFGMSDAPQSGESPPDDEFADILNHIADELYDADKIESLGYQLGIMQGDIQRALMTNTKFTCVTSDGTRHMLKKWRIGVSRKDERMKLEKAMRAAKLVNLADRYFTKGDITSKNQEDLTDGSRRPHPDQSPESSTEIVEASEVSLEHVSSDGVPPVNDMTSVSTIRPEEQSSSHEMQDLPEDMSEIAPLLSSGMVGQNKRTAVDEIRRKPKQSKSSNN